MPSLAGFTVARAGPGITCANASPTILNCRIEDNTQAGIKITQSGNPKVINCIIEGNGGPDLDMTAARTGRFVKFNYATVAHCAIVGNSREGIEGGKPTVVNSIVRSNGAVAGVPQIAADVPTVRYCDIQGGFAGEGNIDVDPEFVTPGCWANSGVWVGGDYHLSDGSPCIDAGDPASTAGLVLTDMDGQPRVINGRPDIGCDEAGGLAPDTAPGGGLPILSITAGAGS